MGMDGSIVTRRVQRTVFLYVSLYVVFWAVHGYNYGTNVHHDQILPFVLRSLHPNAFANDPYVATLAHYPSLFPWGMAFIAKTGYPLPTLFGLLQGVTVIVLVAGMVALLETLLESPPAVVLGSILLLASQFLNGQSFFGEDAIFRSYLEPTTLAWAVLLWALSFWFRGRSRWALLLFGLAADINPMPAFHVGLALVMSELLSVRKGNWRALITQWAGNAVVGAAASAPLLIRMARMPPQPAVDSQQVVQALKAWYPFHYFPDTWPLGKWLVAIAYVSLYAVLLLQAEPTLRRRLQYWMAATAVVISIGFAGAALQSSLLIRMQFLRADALLIIFGVALTARAVVDRLQRNSLHDVLWGGVLAATSTVWFCWPLAVTAVLGLVLERVLPLTTARRIVWAIALGACVWSIDRCADGRSALVSPYVALGLGGIAAMMLVPPRPLEAATQRVLSAAVLLLVFSPFLVVLQERFASGTLSDVDGEVQSMSDEWLELQAWCRQHTAVGSRFIVPSDMWSFRADSERNVFFHWVDGAAMHWDPAFVSVFRERLAAVHGDLPAMERQWSLVARQRYPVLFEPVQSRLPRSPVELAFDGLTAETFMRLKESYHLDYLVTAAAVPSLPFPIVREGRYYRLYELTWAGAPRG